jgi:hypothetical protein
MVVKCRLGRYGSATITSGTSVPCVSCGAGMTTLDAAPNGDPGIVNAGEAASCACRPGYGFVTPATSPPTCAPCAANTYAVGYTRDGCGACPANQAAPSIRSSACVCAANVPLDGGACTGTCATGTTKAAGNTTCTTCAVGYYGTGGSAPCTQCPTNSTTLSTGASSCVCQQGYYGAPESCAACPASFTTSGAGSNDCVCAPGTGFVSDACVTCTGGLVQTTYANATCHS